MKRKANTFYCFSPPVMLATFAVEACLLIYTVIRYKMSTAVRLAVAMLGFLAVFQLAEYFVCGGLSLDSRTWSRIGYVAITTLPPLGFHLLHVLARKPGRRLVGLAYLSALAFIVYFSIDTQVFTSYVCTGNYVIFRIGHWQAIAYGAFYYGWLALSLGLGMRWARLLRGQKTKATDRSARAVTGLIAGYLVFLLPTVIVNTLKSETTAGIPSIMCGFAVLFAFILVFRILPAVDKE